MDDLSSVQSNGFKTFSDLVSNFLSKRTVSLSSEDPVVVSQTQHLLSDPYYHNLIDGIIAECIKMKFAHELFREAYGGKQHNKDENAYENADVGGRVNENVSVRDVNED